MNKKKKILLFIVLGIMFIFASAVMLIVNNNSDSGNNSNDNNVIDDELIEKNGVCWADYQNVSLRKKETDLKDKNIKINVLSCLNNENRDNDKIRFYSKKDDSMYFEVSILEDELDTYLKSLTDEYLKFQPTENYHLAVVDDYVVDSNHKYDVVYSYRKNDNGDIIYKDYNMIKEIDDEHIVHIKLFTNRQNFESGFVQLIAKSIEIK